MDNKEIYRKYARYYDTYVKDFDADIEMYLHFLSSGQDLLEIGCGTGRVLEQLVNTGAYLVGVDISEEMLEIASRKLKKYTCGRELRLLKHDFIEKPLNATFDRVYISYYTFNYLLEENEARAFLKNVYDCMRNGAILLIDLFIPSFYRNPENEGKWKIKKLYLAGKETKLLDKRTMQGNLEERVQIYIENGFGDEIITYRRFYDKGEMGKILESVGLTNILTTNGYDYKHLHKIEPNEITDSNFIVMAEKP